MDNLTHSLVGLAIANVAAEHVARRSTNSSSAAVHAPKRTFTVSLIGIIASNLPDIDLVLSGLTAGKLGYLLHHRGHTHTLVGLLFLAVGLLLILRIWSGFKFQHHAARSLDWRLIALVTVVSLFLHLLMDFGNVYGVHPFWPLDTNWFYGDSLFIVEPWLWLSLSIGLWANAEFLWSKIFYSFVIISAFSLIVFSQLVPAVMIAVVLAWSLFEFFIVRQASRLFRSLVTLGAAAMLCLIFVYGHAFAKYLATSALAAGSAELHLKDMVMTPLPANPLCWRLIAVGVETEQLVLRRGTLSLLPKLIAPAACPIHEGTSTARMAPIRNIDQAIVSKMVIWFDEFRAPLSELRGFASDCRIAALLRFVRVPFWQQASSGQITVGDLRYDRDEELGFTEMSFDFPPEGAIECPKYVPTWLAPSAKFFSF